MLQDFALLCIRQPDHRDLGDEVVVELRGLGRTATPEGAHAREEGRIGAGAGGPETRVGVEGTFRIGGGPGAIEEPADGQIGGRKLARRRGERGREVGRDGARDRSGARTQIGESGKAPIDRQGLEAQRGFGDLPGHRGVVEAAPKGGRDEQDGLRLGADESHLAGAVDRQDRILERVEAREGADQDEGLESGGEHP